MTTGVEVAESRASNIRPSSSGVRMVWKYLGVTQFKKVSDSTPAGSGCPGAAKVLSHSRRESGSIQDWLAETTPGSARNFANIWPYRGTRAGSAIPAL